jgi:uncharacterized protein YjbI with pentapeptide repeats
MNKSVRKLFGVIFQSQQTQQVAPSSPEEWRQHWLLQGQPWRTEPEIDPKRQQELNKHRAIIPDIERGIYPFKGMKLSRADVEWLLASHENGRGPVDWSERSQRERAGLDLRSADLCQVDLSNLPLTNLCGGLQRFEWFPYDLSEQQRNQAALLMQRANLRGAQLQGAHLYRAQLQQTDFYQAQLQEADLRSTNLERANLRSANLENTYLVKAKLKGVHLGEANLKGTNLRMSLLDGSDLRNIKLDDEKQVGPRLADVDWGYTNLAVVDWTTIKILGDEHKARQRKRHDGKKKDQLTRLKEYQEAVRANRQLAVELQNQGLNEDAARLAYRAQVLQRKVFWKQREFGKWLFSLLLALLAGYGYRMWRILVAYLFIVLLSALAYFVLGMYYEPHLSFLDAVLTSVTAFHGRVFSEPFLHPGEPQLWVTAFEAVMGLVIEGVFIAMLTQKFFGK